MNILTWNCRGLNASSKRHRLRDIIVANHIDIVTIQETKKENFTTRQLKSISSQLDIWFWLPSSGRSGGILLEGIVIRLQFLLILYIGFVSTLPLSVNKITLIGK